MPEGHTIRRLARTHERRFVGHEVAVCSPQGRFAQGAELVDGRVLRSVDALFESIRIDLENCSNGFGSTLQK